MTVEETIRFLEKVPPFDSLDEPVLASVAASATMITYPANTLILRQDGPPSENLLVIIEGGVKVSVRSDEGEEVITDYRGAEDLIGYLSLFSGDKSRANVVTTEETRCCLINRETMQTLMDGNPAVREFFHQSFLSNYLDKTFKSIHDKGLTPGCGNRYLFTTPLGELAGKGVKTASPDISIREASALMSRDNIGCLVVVDAKGVPSGIITNRDLRDKVVTPGRDINDAVSSIMSTGLVTAEIRDYCFEALLTMIRHNIHHLLVMDAGAIRGIITNHDIMMLQGTSPLTLARDIESRDSVEGLAALADKTNYLTGLLIKEGTKATGIAKIISELNDRMLKKILEIGEARFGTPPLPYCWIVLGSEGRKEQTFKTDQDNALIYADPSSDAEEEEANAYFEPFTAFVRDSLVQCGFPLCPGNYMASNPQWRRPLRDWKKYFSSWINEPTGDALLKSLIFFDFRPIHGDFSLASRLRDFLVALLDGNKVFLGSLANTIIKNRPPIGFLKSFIVEKSGEHKDKLDLKIKGIALLVDMMRLFALERGARETGTIDRVEALKSVHTIVTEHADEIERAFEFIMFRRIQHQFRQLEEGRDPDNFINPNMLSNLDKRMMRDIFQFISKMQDNIIERYKSMIW